MCFELLVNTMLSVFWILWLLFEFLTQNCTYITINTNTLHSMIMWAQPCSLNQLSINCKMWVNQNYIISFFLFAYYCCITFGVLIMHKFVHLRCLTVHLIYFGIRVLLMHECDNSYLLLKRWKLLSGVAVFLLTITFCSIYWDPLVQK